MLNILIPTLEKRKDKFKSLYQELYRQKTEAFEAVEILFLKDNGEMSIGAKRNKLLDIANENGYVAFIDDDDRISPSYIKNLFEGIKKGVDCCSLIGEITVNGRNAKPFYHSLKYDRYFDDANGYYRFPNHLNCIKAEIAKQFKFPETSHGEDTNFAYQLHNAKVLKTEHEIKEVIYYYDYIPNK